VASEELGNIHVYTGAGKGKTTAAFGLAMRAVGNELTVLIIQFLKGNGDFGEIRSAAKLGIKVEQFGTGRFLQGENITEEDRKQAVLALERSKKAVIQNEADLIILDEINVAISFGLISMEDVLEIIDKKPRNIELVLTGRDAKQEIIARANYVTEMLLQKHPYNVGQPPRAGIEY